MNLEEYLNQKNIDKELSEAILSFQVSSKLINNALVEEEVGITNTQNSHGEDQMNLDVICDEIMINEFKKCPGIACLISEEQENVLNLNSSGSYTACYDPIDGSSLLDVNLSVGSIFCFFEGKNVIGKQVKEMKCAGCIVYGPRISMLLSLGDEVVEFTLLQSGSSESPNNYEFVLSKEDISISHDTKLFSPGNLRACRENPKYKAVMDKWLEQGKTLRYSGGMVPDVNAIFMKGQGIFSYPGHSKYPNGKLRLCYEVGPFTFMARSCGGESLTDKGEDIMEIRIEDIHQRCPIMIGSQNEVNEIIKMLN